MLKSAPESVMKIGNGHAVGAMSGATTRSSCYHGQPRTPDEPPVREAHNAFILLVVALFDSLVQFYRLAAELPPEHRT